MTSQYWSRLVFNDPARDSDYPGPSFEDVASLATASMPSSHGTKSNRTLAAVVKTIGGYRPPSDKCEGQWTLVTPFRQMLSEASRECVTVGCPTLMESQKIDVGSDGVSNINTK